MDSSVQGLCKAKGVSMLELADKSGIDLMRVKAIFLGRWTPTPEERQRIATTLGVAIDGVAWGHNTPIQHIWGSGPG